LQRLLPETEFGALACEFAPSETDASARAEWDAPLI
jgi:hypothetical protein